MNYKIITTGEPIPAEERFEEVVEFFSDYDKFSESLRYLLHSGVDAKGLIYEDGEWVPVTTVDILVRTRDIGTIYGTYGIRS